MLTYYKTKMWNHLKFGFSTTKTSRSIMIAFLFVIAISCKNSYSHKSEANNLRLINSIFDNPNLSEINKFDLRQNLELYASHWVPLDKSNKVDSLFYKTFLEKEKTFYSYKHYQEFYFVGKILHTNKKYLVISQWIGNGNECYMYLIDFNRYSGIDRLFLIAKQHKGPDDIEWANSFFKNGIITRTSIHLASELNNLVTRDSITEKFKIENFQRIYYDSLRKQ